MEFFTNSILLNRCYSIYPVRLVKGTIIENNSAISKYFKQMGFKLSFKVKNKLWLIEKSFLL